MCCRLYSLLFLYVDSLNQHLFVCMFVCLLVFFSLSSRLIRFFNVYPLDNSISVYIIINQLRDICTYISVIVTIFVYMLYVNKLCKKVYTYYSVFRSNLSRLLWNSRRIRMANLLA